MLKLVKKECVEWFRAFLRCIPGRIGCMARRRFSGAKCGQGVRILSQVYLYHPGQLTIGDRTGISSQTQINSAGDVGIGCDVLIGPGVMIWSNNHHIDSLETPIRLQGHDYKRVDIEDDVWIGAGAIILPGVRLGKGSVVGAGAVVTRSTEPYSIVVGNPARVMGYRNDRAESRDERVRGESACQSVER